MLFESEAVENRDKFEEVYGKETSLKLLETVMHMIFLKS